MSTKERIIKMKYAYHLNLDVEDLDKYSDEELHELLVKLVEWWENTKQC